MTNLPNEQEIRHNSKLIISMMMEFFDSSEIHFAKRVRRSRATSIED